MGNGNFKDCTISNKSGENMGGTYENCTFENINGNIHGNFNISNSTINNWSTYAGAYEPSYTFTNCKLNNFEITFGYWHQGATTLFDNCTINNDDLLNGDYILVKPDKEKINDGFNCHLVSDRIILTDTNLSPALALIAIEHECNPDYCKEVYEEIKNIPDEVSNSDIESRKNHDFRDKTIFTIDGISTKDMDDAVGIEILPNGNYQITVSIAEPNHYVKKGTAIYNEAIQRDFTLYMLNTAIHMFHPKLANGICSLNEKVDRLTKTAIIEIDQEGNIVNSKVCKSVINSKKKMTYDDVNSILENEVTPEGYEPFVKDITPMKEITDKIWDKKEKEGLLELNTVKHEVNIDSNNNVTLVCVRSLNNSQPTFKSLEVGLLPD